jgi:hypothetical protein
MLVLVLCQSKKDGYGLVSHGVCCVAEPSKWRCHSFGTCALHLHNGALISISYLRDTALAEPYGSTSPSGGGGKAAMRL